MANTGNHDSDPIDTLRRALREVEDKAALYRRAIAILEGTDEVKPAREPRPINVVAQRSRPTISRWHGKDTLVSVAEKVLDDAGKPLHFSEIVRRMKTLPKPPELTKAKTANLVRSLNRKAENATGLRKVGPNTFERVEAQAIAS